MNEINLRYKVIASNERYLKELYPLAIYRHDGTERRFFNMFGPRVDRWILVGSISSPKRIEGRIENDARELVEKQRNRLIQESWVPVEFSVTVTPGDGTDVVVEIRGGNE